MILAHRGFRVNIFEKESVVGGRNRLLELDGFKCDLGPTFLIMRCVLDEMFELAGRDINDYLDIGALDPL